MGSTRLTDVAARANVHVSTASRALDPNRAALVNARTRERVIDAAAELGYERPAARRSFTRTRHQTVAVIVPDISNPIFATLIRGIENTLEGRKMMVVVAETQGRTERLQRVIEHLRQRRVDAAITAAAPSSQADVLHDLAQRIPLVLAACSLPGTGLPCVTYDDERGGSLVAEHLLGLGHRRFGMLRGPQDIATFAARTTGFRRRLDAEGIDTIEPRRQADRPTMHEGFRLASRLLDDADHRPSAIFAQNDELAVGALEALRVRGFRCPEDVALVGYNDVPVARLLTPALSTVRLPAYALGRISADMAVSVITGDATPFTELTMPVSLHARASTLGDRWRGSPIESERVADAPG